MRPAEAPTPGETGARAAAKAHRAVHHVGDRAIDTGNLVAAKVVIRAEGIEPVLPRLDHALPQLLVRRPTRRKTAFGVQCSGAAFVIEPVMGNAAALPRRAIAVMFCNGGQCFRNELPSRRQISAASVTCEWRQRRARAAFQQAVV